MDALLHDNYLTCWTKLSTLPQPAMPPQLKGFKPALIIVDMQNAFCHKDGSFSKLGLSVEIHMQPVPSIQRLRQLAEEFHFPVVFTRENWNEDYTDSGILLDQYPAAALKDIKGMIRGSWDADIIDELKPGPSDVVVDKTRTNAFLHSDLAERLEEHKVNLLIVAGVRTNVCVESTVRHAYEHDWRCVTVSDATATVTEGNHDASLRSLQWFGGVATVDEIEASLLEDREQA